MVLALELVLELVLGLVLELVLELVLGLVLGLALGLALEGGLMSQCQRFLLDQMSLSLRCLYSFFCPSF
jgi:hypothetical protein